MLMHTLKFHQLRVNSGKKCYFEIALDKRNLLTTFIWLQTFYALTVSTYPE